MVYESVSCEVKQYALELAEAVLASTPTAGLIEVLKLAFGKYVPGKAKFPPEEDPTMYDLVEEDEDPSEVQKAGDQEENLPEGSVGTLNLEAEAAEVEEGGPQNKFHSRARTWIFEVRN